MKRVAILKSRIAFQGGLERYAKNIAISFAKKGFQVTLLTTGPSIEIEKVKVVSFGPHPSFLSLSFFKKRVQHWLLSHPQNIVFGLDRNIYQTHYRAGNGSHKTFLKKTKKKFIDSFLSKLNPKNYSIINTEKKLFENSSLKKLFTNSYQVKKELLSHYSIPYEKIEVIHNGVDLKIFNFDKDSKKLAQREIHIPLCQIHFLFVGNNFERKGLTPLLNALRELKNKSFHLSVIGKDKRLSKYQSLCFSLGLEKKVTFWGPQKDLLPFYKSADCLVLPTFYDPFANVTVEALAMGLFVITSDFNGGSEVLTKETGRVLLNFKEDLVRSLEKVFLLSMDYEKKLMIRKSIAHLDLNSQLNKIVELTVNNS